MAYEHKAGTFSLFKNDKGDNESRPDYKGEGKDLDGKAIEVAAWLKDGGRGKFMSCTLKLKGEAPAIRQQAAPQDGGVDIADDIPF